MKKTIQILVIITSLLPFKVLCASGGVRNGGDGVTCHDGNLYSLDYVLNLPNGSALGTYDHLAPEVRESSSIEDLFDKIKSRIDTAFEESFKQSLISFQNLLSNHDDWSAERIWLDSAEELAELSDEKMLRILNRNCRPYLNKDEKALLNQIVIREDKKIIIYNVDQDDLKQLRKTHMLQEAHLLLHEWLRDHFEGADDIRNAIRYILSPNFFNDDSQKIYKAFQNLEFRQVTYKNDSRKMFLKYAYFPTKKHIFSTTTISTDNEQSSYLQQKISYSIIDQISIGALATATKNTYDFSESGAKFSEASLLAKWRLRDEVASKFDLKLSYTPRIGEKSSGNAYSGRSSFKLVSDFILNRGRNEYVISPIVQWYSGVKYVESEYNSFRTKNDNSHLFFALDVVYRWHFSRRHYLGTQLEISFADTRAFPVSAVRNSLTIAYGFLVNRNIKSTIGAYVQSQKSLQNIIAANGRNYGGQLDVSFEL